MKCNETNYIQRLKNHKEDALEYVVDKYIPLVKGTTYKVLAPLKNEWIIEECINDVFLSVWNNSDKFNGNNDDFKKWIFKIAKFKAIDYYRKEIKHLNKNIKVLCDEKWFIEALENIIKNCLEKNSTPLSIFAYENETTLKMMIQDQGNGFKKKDLPFLFQRFYRGENSKGTGLGLYIAKEIIEAHHGFMKAYNQQGACFEIVLPQMKMKKKI